MVTATKAREMTNTMIARNSEKEKKVIESLVLETVKRGEGYCYLGFYPSDLTLLWLQTNGYKVTCIVDPDKQGFRNARVEW